MIKLTKKQIENLTPVGPMVLVRPDRKVNEISIKDGKLYFDPSYNPEMHAPISGVVVCAPSKIPVEKQPIGWGVNEVEIQKGDTVFFSYLEGAASFDDKIERNIIDEDNQLYFWISYTNIFAYDRNGQKFSCGHYYIVEVLNARIETKGVVLPKFLLEKKANKVCKVILAPKSKQISYFNPKYSFVSAPENSHIFVGKFDIQPFEHELHRKFMGRDKELGVVAGIDILAIITDINLIKIE